MPTQTMTSYISHLSVLVLVANSCLFDFRHEAVVYTDHQDKELIMLQDFKRVLDKLGLKLYLQNP